MNGFLAGVRAKPVGALAVAELGHHLALDLADPLPGQPEELADLVEGARLTVVEAEPQPNDLLFALVEGGQHVADVGVQQLGDDRVLGRHRLGVFDEVAERGFLVAADRHVEAHRVAAVLEQIGDLLRRDAGFGGQLLVGGLTAEILMHLALMVRLWSAMPRVIA